jgi:hypothetical protein
METTGLICKTDFSATTSVPEKSTESFKKITGALNPYAAY